MTACSYPWEKNPVSDIVYAVFVSWDEKMRGIDYIFSTHGEGEKNVKDLVGNPWHYLEDLHTDWKVLLKNKVKRMGL